MKLSLRQILASSVGAVLAAIIASTFGEQGTIIGVAIGSVIATTSTVFIAQSVERAHRVVRQRVGEVKKPELLRRFGATAVAGEVIHSPADAAVALDGEPGGDGGSAARDRADTQDVEGPPGEVLGTEPVSDVRDAVGADRSRWRWPVVAGAAGGVFVLALVLVTVIELLAGKPISSIFGSNSGNEPSIGRIFTPVATTTTSTTTTSTTSTSTSTTTTTGPTDTTSTSTTPGTSTTTSPGSTSTTSSTTTTTLVPFP
jgi:hypothetical protein